MIDTKLRKGCFEEKIYYSETLEKLTTLIPFRSAYSTNETTAFIYFFLKAASINNSLSDDEEFVRLDTEEHGVSDESTSFNSFFSVLVFRCFFNFFS